MLEPQTRASGGGRQLQTITDEILAEVRALPPELIHWVPGEGVWSVMDNLCHIREFVPFWTGETLRIVRRPDEQWGRDHTDTARLAAVTEHRREQARRCGGRHPRAVRRSAETLSDLSDADLAVEAPARTPGGD